MEKTDSFSEPKKARYCPMYRIDTTLGELIAAISEATSEARVDESELMVITQLVLQKLTRCKD